MTDFVEFPKIPRLTRECVITEKIDGTNGQIFIGEDGEFLVGSRSRWLTPETGDNHGFMAWALAHKDELVAGLGPGRHFGEWWGSGIQRGYGLAEKRFSLFNSARWVSQLYRPDSGKPALEEKQQWAPACCHVVPILYRGIFDTASVYFALGNLAIKGSAAAPGFRQPEGVVVWHTHGNFGMKKTLLKDEERKGKK